MTPQPLYAGRLPKTVTAPPADVIIPNAVPRAPIWTSDRHDKDSSNCGHRACRRRQAVRHGALHWPASTVRSFCIPHITGEWQCTQRGSAATRGHTASWTPDHVGSDYTAGPSIAYGPSSIFRSSARDNRDNRTGALASMACGSPFCIKKAPELSPRGHFLIIIAFPSF